MAADWSCVGTLHDRQSTVMCRVEGVWANWDSKVPTHPFTNASVGACRPVWPRSASIVWSGWVREDGEGTSKLRKPPSSLNSSSKCVPRLWRRHSLCWPCGHPLCVAMMPPFVRASWHPLCLAVVARPRIFCTTPGGSRFSCGVFVDRPARGLFGPAAERRFSVPLGRGRWGLVRGLVAMASGGLMAMVLGGGSCRPGTPVRSSAGRGLSWRSRWANVGWRASGRVGGCGAVRRCLVVVAGAAWLVVAAVVPMDRRDLAPRCLMGGREGASRWCCSSEHGRWRRRRSRWLSSEPSARADGLVTRLAVRGRGRFCTTVKGDNSGR